jgi:hypothetical protein
MTSVVSPSASLRHPPPLLRALSPQSFVDNKIKANDAMTHGGQALKYWPFTTALEGPTLSDSPRILRVGWGTISQKYCRNRAVISVLP